MNADELQSALCLIRESVELSSVTINADHYGLNIWIDEDEEISCTDKINNIAMKLLDDLGFCCYEDYPNKLYKFF